MSTATSETRRHGRSDQRSPIPRADGFDNSLALRREGYRFISRRCDALGTDAFRTRLMLRSVVCLRGGEAAGVFYGGAPLSRRGAAPKSAMRLLQDEGSVQTLEGCPHRQRKALFMRLVDEAALAELSGHFATAFDEAATGWAKRPHIVLHEELVPILTRAATSFCGLPSTPADRPDLVQELAAMIEKAGAIGPGNWLARFRRRGTEKWAADTVRESRQGPAASPFLDALAALPGEDGQPLPLEVAAVELLNLLRPVVAVGRYIVFGALALHRHPQWREAVATDEAAAERFCAEVRRFYPFFPAVGAYAREPFAALGHDFAAGDWLLFDIYGTNRHPDLWEAPEAFRPERFAGTPWPASPLTAQGGGDWPTTHRCPGEHATMALMRVALRRLAGRLHYRVPPQDLDVDLSRMPALPEDGFVLSDIRPA
jgi:fatty-acid peroxygenase